FSTQGELNDWMAVQDNVAKLAIGDNLYIVDKEVTDYWWDGTNIKVLETELPDMSNVVTTLGAATGGGNAITDILIDGNLLTQAKNKNFVDTDYDQSISGQKTFNTTIHSVGIMVQTYDNSSVICAGGGVRSIADIQSASYSKSEDDALLLLKADKTQLIDSYTKGETDNLLNNKANTGVSYTKSEDDALLFAKADKTQLIDSYTKGETDNLLNNKANTGVSYTKGEDDTLLFAKADKTQLIDSYTKGEADNLLNNKANQTTTYTKLETDQLISQIEVGEVDLSGYMTLGTSQTITANKSFNNACRFISSIDGLSTVTGSSFVKSGADDTVVLLGAGGTKPISEFAGSPTDLSNYYTKAQTFSQTEANNKFVRLEGSIQQTITGRLKYVSPFDYPDETQDPEANTYLTMSEVDAKLTNVVTANTTQSIIGAKTFNANVTATGFAKTGKDDTLVLLAGGGDQLLSSFGGVQVEDITSLVVNLHSNIQFNHLKLVRIDTFYTLMMEIIPKTQIAISTQTTICTVGSISNTITPPTPPSTTYPISLATNRKTLTCVYSYRDFKISTDSTAAWASQDVQLKARQLCCLFLNYKMSNVYIDEALLDAAGLSEFPELYDYIHEREPKPIVDGIANQIIVGSQYFQDQVKDNDDKINVQPIPQPIVPIEIPQLRNKVVYNIGLYLSNDFMGFVFTNFLEELWPFSKHALVLGDDVGHKQNVMGYISEKGPYLDVSIGSVDQVTSIKGNTHVAIAGVYYTDYEPLKRATNDVNGDGKINIVDDWHVNSIIDGMKSMSWVQDVVQKQTEAIDDGVQPYDPSQPVSLSNYFNNNTKLVNNNTFGPLRAAYFVKEGLICTFNFQAEVSSQHVNNVFKVFKTIDSDLQPRLPKFFPIKTSFTSFAGMIQINGNDTPDVVVNQGSGFYPMDLCDFSGSYLIDPQPQESNQNNITSNGEPISHIDSVIMSHDTLPSVPIPPSVSPQYTVAEVSRDQLLALDYTPYDLDAFKIYIIDDTVNKLVMFNMHLRQKGFIDTKQYVLSMSESIDPKKTLLFPVMILYDFNTDPIQDIPSAYLTVADTDNPARWHNHISSQLKADKFVNYYLGGSYFV
ncbi:MAG: hypothetical protein EZS28_029788, partial [Streblomastix strix]